MKENYKPGDIYYQDISDVTAGTAVTYEPANLGANLSQEVRAVPYVWEVFDRYFTTTQLDTVPKTDGELYVDMSGRLINTVIITPTVRGAPVVCSVGRYPVRWVLAGGVYYPTGDVVCTLQTGSVVLRLPARPNWTFSFAPRFTGSGAGYDDYYQVVCALLPNDATIVAP